jgi:hypothetical protein
MNRSRIARAVFALLAAPRLQWLLHGAGLS